MTDATQLHESAMIPQEPHVRVNNVIHTITSVGPGGGWTLCGLIFRWGHLAPDSQHNLAIYYDVGTAVAEQHQVTCFGCLAEEGIDVHQSLREAIERLP